MVSKTVVVRIIKLLTRLLCNCKGYVVKPVLVYVISVHING